MGIMEQYGLMKYDEPGKKTVIAAIEVNGKKVAEGPLVNGPRSGPSGRGALGAKNWLEPAYKNGDNQWRTCT